LDEYDLLLKTAYEKVEASKILFENKFYADSVSRAYYAMFFAARALLSLKNIYPRTHRGVLAQLGLEFITKGYLDKISAKALSTAMEDREDADYGILSEITKEESKQIIEDTKRFIGNIEKAIEKIRKENQD